MIDFLKERRVIFIFAFGALVILLFLIFIFMPKSSVKYPAPIITLTPMSLETPFPVSSDTSIDYSNLNKLVPGKSTLEEVRKLNGPPETTSFSGKDTVLYYPTPLERFKNEVVLRNNVVYYVSENIFGNYRGSFSSFQNAYGSSFLKMYKKGEPYVWYIYPTKGIGAESDGTDLLVIIHFPPLSENDFIKNIAPGLSLLTEPPPISE